MGTNLPCLIKPLQDQAHPLPLRPDEAAESQEGDPKDSSVFEDPWSFVRTDAKVIDIFTVNHSALRVWVMDCLTEFRRHSQLTQERSRLFCLFSSQGFSLAVEIETATPCGYCKDETNRTWNCPEQCIVCGMCSLSSSVSSLCSRYHKQFSFEVILVLNLKFKEVKVKTNNGS